MPLSSLFRTYEGNSFIHQLDPRTKLICLCLVSFLAVFFVHALYLIGLFCFVFFCHLNTKIPWTKTKYLYFAYPLIFLFIALGQGFFFWGAQLTPLFTLISKEGAVLGWPLPGISALLKYFPGEVVFYKEGFIYGLIQAFRTATLLTAGLTLALTTHPVELLYALRKFKLPYELCFLISMSLRFIPQIMDETRENFRAQQARGFVLKKFSLKDKIVAVSQICDTLIIRWIQGVRDMALAIDLRGFRLHPQRTFVHERTLEKGDWVVLSVSVIVFGILLIRT